MPPQHETVSVEDFETQSGPPAELEPEREPDHELENFEAIHSQPPMAGSPTQDGQTAAAAQPSVEAPYSAQQPSSHPSSQPQHPDSLPTRFLQDQLRDKSQSPSTDGRDSPSTPGPFVGFDWQDFEARYESALRDADLQEQAILQEAENLSSYFRAWASAASVQDNERAVKRLRTRQRFVNLSEEKLAQKQQHYEQVFQAFQSALALLKSQ